MKRTILIIDDDKLFCQATGDFLENEGMEVMTALTGAEGLRLCNHNHFDVVLLDQQLPDAEGHTLCLAIEKAFRMLSLEKVALFEQYRSTKAGEKSVLIGKSPEFREVVRLVDIAAGADASIIITGETGTGKNVAARAIHYSSPLRDKPFVSINCAALPENLIEAELFGYKKGAFTSATSSKRGLFEMAEGGSLFLDEIGEMPIQLQSKLLGVLEDKKVRPIGGEVSLPVDVRVLAATGKNIEQELGKTFRADLFYRLSVMQIHMPPLRSRREDIPVLCEHFIQQIAPGSTIELEDGELDRLMAHDWPGNVRELNNVLERAMIIQKGPLITPSRMLLKGSVSDIPPPADAMKTDSIPTLEEMEKQHIRKALDVLSGNYTRTAKALGIALSTLKRKVKKYGLR